MNIDILYFIIGIIILLAAIFTIIKYSQNCIKIYKDYRSIIINLARRRNRMIQFSNHYFLPIQYEIFDAIDGKNLDARKLHKDGIIGDYGLQSIINIASGKSKKFHHELCTIGAVGCSLSHIQIWQKIVSENIQKCLIFEDDAWVINADMDIIDANINKLPKDWHIYMIGQPHSILEGIPCDKIGDLHRITRFCGTHAYIINLEGAKWLLEHGKLFPIQQQIDAHLSELCLDFNFNIYIHIKSSHISPFSVHSDIQVNSPDNSKVSWDRYILKNQ